MSEFSAILLMSIVFYAFIALAIYVVTAIFYMKLFKKANAKAWKAWVPFVNTWKFLELGGYPGALVLLLILGVVMNGIYLVLSFGTMFSLDYDALLYGDTTSLASWVGTLMGLSILSMIGGLVSIVAAVFCCMSAYQIGRKLGKDGAWVVLYIFLSIIWLGIVALDKSVWNDSLGRKARGPERPPSWIPAYAGAPHAPVYNPPLPAGYYPPPPPAGAYPPPPQPTGVYPPPQPTGAYPPPPASAYPPPPPPQ
ncbi:MAG: DUF5684 domain-containing protein [Coriobacteriia bacterium]|nr:DUF5684 domain-containing protein [Coriobacteriia bacterium]MCL2749882.1 DUF5684 domain-containing protein [Coriobacteriia bacterium]